MKEFVKFDNGISISTAQKSSGGWESLVYGFDSGVWICESVKYGSEEEALVGHEGLVKDMEEKLKSRLMCSVGGCSREMASVSSGLCASHRYRLKRYGNVRGKMRVLREEPEYGVWQNMKYCSKTECLYASYDEFLNDVGRKENPEDVLCRRDLSLGYCVGNCYWGNRCESHGGDEIEYMGRKMSVVAWGKELGMSSEKIYYRLKHGWSVERALEKK